jgi:membrane protease YdiL (CAAX protease family)
VLDRPHASDGGSNVARGTRPGVAPAWHTVLLVVAVLASALLPSSAAPSGVLPLVAVQMALLAYVLGGMRLRGVAPRELLGRASPLDLIWGLIAAAALVGLWLLARPLLPAPEALQGGRAAWLLLAALVAVSEEVVFRGYLQRQFESPGGGWALAALGQAAVFAVAHANQGASTAAAAGVCGLSFAALSRARRGLAAPIVAHFLFDGCAVLWP